MKASELRLGNEVLKVNVDSLPEERLILTPQLLLLYKLWGCTLKPIPLTDTEYQNFGFTWSQKRCTWTKGDLTICDWNDEVQYISVGTDDVDYEIEPSPGFIKIKKLNYVHELQNLYFSLKREELVQSGFVLTI